MKRCLPYPLISLALGLLWLLLNQSVEPAHLLLAALLAFAIPLLMRNLQPLAAPRMKRPRALLRLLGMSFVEIVRSAFNVGRIILFVRPHTVRSQFIRVPLDLRSSYGLAILSSLINSTPGTVWVELLPGSHVLALHVLDLHDEQWWVDTIKTRYEQPLIDVFE
jgi:multicomponent K+:H+ antiporter subunit E